MINGQFRLKGEVELQRDFLKELFLLDFADCRRWYDTLDCTVSASRKRDSTMTLECFSGLVTPSFDFVLQFASPFPNMIRYMASGDVGRVTRFAWVECSYVQSNCDSVLGLYECVYGKKLE